MLVTVSGLPGAGTTTACRLVADELGLEHVHAGVVFRRLAAERGLTLAELGAAAEADDQVDRDLDALVLARASEGDCVVEGRLAGWVTHRAGLEAVRVWVACDPAIRAQRVAGREGLAVERARADNDEREASERARYQRIYGIDVDDLSVYDLVLDSATAGPDEIAAEVVAAARRRFVA